MLSKTLIIWKTNKRFVIPKFTVHGLSRMELWEAKLLFCLTLALCVFWCLSRAVDHRKALDPRHLCSKLPVRPGHRWCLLLSSQRPRPHPNPTRPWGRTSRPGNTVTLTAWKLQPHRVVVVVGVKGINFSASWSRLSLSLSPYILLVTCRISVFVEMDCMHCAYLMQPFVANIQLHDPSL